MAEQIQILQRRLEDNFPRQKNLCRGDVVPTFTPLCVTFQWSFLSSLLSAYLLSYLWAYSCSWYLPPFCCIVPVRQICFCSSCWVAPCECSSGPGVSKTKTLAGLKRRSSGLKRRPPGLKRRPHGLKRRPPWTKTKTHVDFKLLRKTTPASVICYGDLGM